LASTDKEWERLGRTEPLYGVWTDEQFLSASRDKEAEERFWASGERRIESVFRTIEKHIQTGFRPEEALDFGCGVGRLLLPMSVRCTRVTGVDVSVSMLKVARDQLSNRSVANVSLVHAGDGSFLGPGYFDFIHSYIVFQHIPLSRGYTILGQLLERLKPGGIAVLHFSYKNHTRNRWLRILHKLPPGKIIGNLLRGKSPHEPVMQMNEYDLSRVLECVQPVSDEGVHIEFTDHGVLGAVLYFRRA